MTIATAICWVAISAAACTYLIMQGRNQQMAGWQACIHHALEILESLPMSTATRYTLLIETNPNRTDGYTYPTLQAADASRLANNLPRTAIVQATPDAHGNYPALTAAELDQLPPHP